MTLSSSETSVLVSSALVSSVLVSVLSPDHVGLISAISSRLFDLGANLGNTSFAVIGGDAEFMAVCEFPTDMDLVTLLDELKALPELHEAEIKVSQFDANSDHAASETITHTLTVSGGDSPGLMARLCEVFQQFDANIVRLNSERVPMGETAQYVISMAVSIPPQNTNSCLATIGNTTGELGLKHDFKNV